MKKFLSRSALYCVTPRLSGTLGIGDTPADSRHDTDNLLEGNHGTISAHGTPDNVD